jgi:hypothetical protein
MAIRILRQQNGRKTIETSVPIVIKSWMLFVVINLLLSLLLYLVFDYYGFYSKYIYPQYLFINYSSSAVTIIGTISIFLWKPFDRFLGKYAVQGSPFETK